MKAKLNLKNKAIELRKLGKSYSEILREVKVAKSTLSLWLRLVGLSKKQIQRLTLKKLQSARRGGDAKRQQRMEKSNRIIEEAERDVEHISERELWLIGTMLYWAEGKKEKDYSPGTGVGFCNSDYLMIKVYLKWLKTCLKIPEDRLVFEIYIHETHKDKVEEIRSFWSKETRFPLSFFRRIYFKKNKLSGNRKNKGIGYHGLLTINVRKSSELNRKITGWILGVGKQCRVV